MEHNYKNSVLTKNSVFDEDTEGKKVWMKIGFKQKEEASRIYSYIQKSIIYIYAIHIYVCIYFTQLVVFASMCVCVCACACVCVCVFP